MYLFHPRYHCMVDIVQEVGRVQWRVYNLIIGIEIILYVLYLDNFLRLSSY